jgi:hypothetical protein
MKYVSPSNKTSLVVSPRYLEAVRHDAPGDVREAAVCHAHFSVPESVKQLILAAGSDWRATCHADTYLDTRDASLLKDNIWLRIRDTKCFAFKCLAKDDNNVLDYIEMTGPVKELRRWALPRLLFTLKIVRFRRDADPHTWVDFVTIEDGKGQQLFDCVGTVHGKERKESALGAGRCGCAFFAAKFLDVQGLVASVSDGTKDEPMLEKPEPWPVWCSPLEPVADDERARALAFAAQVRDEELAAK